MALRMIGTDQDNSEHKQVAQALRENEKRMQLFIEHAPAAIAMFDRTMCYIEASHRWRTDYGLGNKEIVGRSHYEIFPEIRDDLKDVHRRGLTGEIMKGENYHFERLDGSVQYVRWEMYPWYDSDGKVGGIVIFTEDVTERKKAEIALQQSETEFRAMFEVASIGMAQADIHTGRWLRVNQKMCSIIGYSESELLQLRLFEITHPEDREKDWEAFQSVVRGETSDYRMEKRYIRKDGSVAWVNVNMTVIRNESGQAIRTMATIEDIAERKQSEEALRESERQLSTLMTNLPGMVYRCQNTPEWPMTFVSDGCTFLTGYANTQLIMNQPSYGNIIIAEDRQYVWNEVQLALDARQPFELTYRIRTSEQNIKWVWERGRGVFSRHNELLFIEGFIADISEKKQIEQEREIALANIEHCLIHCPWASLSLTRRATSLNRIDCPQNSLGCHRKHKHSAISMDPNGRSSVPMVHRCRRKNLQA